MESVKIGIWFKRRFSALQRAENSSIERNLHTPAVVIDVSVLFSEPKIPQCVPAFHRWAM